MKSRNKGIVFILLAAFFFSGMTVCVRLAGELPTMEKTFFRNFVAAIVSWIMIFQKKESLTPIKSNWKDLMMRSICGTLGMICNFYAIDQLNISDANLLNKLSPFFAILMSIIILKEKPKKLEWCAVFIALLGALFVIKPGFSFTSFAAFIGLLGGFGAGVAYTFVRKMGMNGVRGPIIVMFFSTFSTLFTLPFLILQFQPMSMRQLFILLLSGVFATGGQLSITNAYTYAPAKEISVYDYTQVLFASIWGFLLFDQIPDLYSWIGYIIILGAVLLRYFYNKKQVN